MKKLLIINVSANSGSTGRIAEDIGRLAMSNGYECYFAYGRIVKESKCQLIRIGTDWDIIVHGLQSRFLDNHGFASKQATQKFIDDIERIQPDIINIHNIHGYYVNMEVLLDYFAQTSIPVVWTLHDCWNFTGHCAFFDYANCERWKTHCHHCPRKRSYPSSYFLDASSRNFDKKKELFSKMKNIYFITPSQWLAALTRESFLFNFPVQVINNGVDLNVFKPIESSSIKYELGIAPEKKVILGVASVWHKRKGLDDFVQLSKILQNHVVILVGLTDGQIKALPDGLIGINRTESIEKLAGLYCMADVFVNPTYADNFPTTNIEALACGTPVVTYRTGGSPEAIDVKTGGVVERGDVHSMAKVIAEVLSKNRDEYRIKCRTRAECLYDKKRLYQDYINLFNSIVR